MKPDDANVLTEPVYSMLFEATNTSRMNAIGFRTFSVPIYVP